MKRERETQFCKFGLDCQKVVCHYDHGKYEKRRKEETVVKVEEKEEGDKVEKEERKGLERNPKF